MFKPQRILAVLVTIVAALSPFAPASVQAQAPWSQVGSLNCNLAPSIGLIVVSRQEMSCRFTPSGPFPPQNYVGVLTNVGIDLGFTAGGVLGWGVFSSTVGPPAGGLAGVYGGASAEVTAGIGGGANVLFGGSARSVALQPLSLEGTAGLNVQLGIAGLELRPAP